MKLRNTILSLSALSLGAILMSGCETTSIADSEKTVKQKIHWTHTGPAGAENWANLSDEFATCAAGRLQSPFDITADITADLPNINLNYRPVPMKIINNTHTIQADQANAGQLVVGGESFDLLQFHFHADSEYAINGKKFPLEVHLVHASKAGELAVVGVMFEEGAANPELAKIWANMPTSKGENIVRGQTINARNLLPASREHYRFMGSLTTPPCSEGVNWFVMKQPITASKAQIETFMKLYPMNARPLQDENNRLVVLGR